MRTCTWSTILGQAIVDLLGNSGRKDPDTMFTRKKRSGSETPVLERSTFGRFQKAPDWGQALSINSGSVQIMCDRFYIHVSGVEKLRFRKERGARARGLRQLEYIDLLVFFFFASIYSQTWE